MSTVKLDKVHAAIDLAAKRILDARGSDARTTPEEMKKALGSLKGTEKKFADAFFKFIDARNGDKPYVTKSDVTAAVRYAKQTLVDAYDTNKDGALDAKEKKGLSKTGRLAVSAAKALEGNGELSSADVAKRLGALSSGLYMTWFGNEGDSTFKSFVKPGNGGRVTVDEVRSAMNRPATEKYLEKDINEFFQGMQQPDQVGDATDRAKFAEIERTMKAELSDLKVFVQDEGTVDGKVYFVGRAKDGNLVGLESNRIWT